MADQGKPPPPPSRPVANVWEAGGTWWLVDPGTRIDGTPTATGAAAMGDVPVDDTAAGDVPVSNAAMADAAAEGGVASAADGCGHGPNNTPSLPWPEGAVGAAVAAQAAQAARAASSTLAASVVGVTRAAYSCDYAPLDALLAETRHRPELYLYAVQGNHLGIIMHLTQRRCCATGPALALATELGHDHLYGPLLVAGHRWSKKEPALAIKQGRLSLLASLHRAGCPLTPDAMAAAVYHDQLEAVRYLLAAGVRPRGDEVEIALLSKMGAAMEERYRTGQPVSYREVVALATAKCAPMFALLAEPDADAQLADSSVD